MLILYIYLIGHVVDNDNNLIHDVFQNVEVEEERVDERSVDDLLSFINGKERGIIGCCFSLLCRLYYVCHFIFIGFILIRLYLIPN